MWIDIYVYSTLLNGALAQPFFKKRFEWKDAPPPNIKTIALGTIGEPQGTLKQGEVIDVRVKGNSGSIKVAVEEASTEELRLCLVPDNWQEVWDYRN